jgi:copper chaperone CopZ
VITTLRITGMTCNGCVRHVDAALRKVPGVTAVEVALPDRAKVVHNATVGQLVEAVTVAGYQADETMVG